ncbi:hypothetical protein LCGC14_3125730, partial [marine sediment metagenome]
MSEEDIKRIENKVDLLYKYLFELGEEDDVPILFEEFLDELIPLFNLSSKNEEFIKIEERPQNIIKSELEDLESSFKQGNYLARDERKIQIKIDALKEELEKAKIGQYNKEQLENLNKEIHKTLLYQDFRKKMGSTTEHRAVIFDIDPTLMKKIDIQKVKSELSKEGIHMNLHEAKS